jgi:hypothetical protein
VKSEAEIDEDKGPIFKPHPVSTMQVSVDTESFSVQVNQSFAHLLHNLEGVVNRNGEFLREVCLRHVNVHVLTFQEIDNHDTATLTISEALFHVYNVGVVDSF